MTPTDAACWLLHGWLLHVGCCMVVMVMDLLGICLNLGFWSYGLPSAGNRGNRRKNHASTQFRGIYHSKSVRIGKGG